MVDQYVPGSCNIGPAEGARRRRVGHLGLALTALLALVLLAFGAARPWRLLLALPATMAAAGYLQARLRFCSTSASAASTTSTPSATRSGSRPRRPGRRTGG